MGSGDTQSQFALGFLTVIEHEQQGLTGGYLILNASGRPLEFHCTAPVKANRAQQILFGPTLAPYLYGEQIGQALITKAAISPLVVWTDVPSALSVRDFVSQPVGLVFPNGPATEVTATPANAATTWRVDGPEPPAAHLSAFSVGRNRVAVTVMREADRGAILEHLARLGDFDLSEPFGRIREAVIEAHKGGRT